MKPKTLYCQIDPTGEGADLTFFGAGSAEPTKFSIDVEHGVVDLRLKVDLLEPRVLECTQEGTDGDDEVYGGVVSSRADHQ